MDFKPYLVIYYDVIFHIDKYYAYYHSDNRHYGLEK
jgi:hypothetical protein